MQISPFGRNDNTFFVPVEMTVPFYPMAFWFRFGWVGLSWGLFSILQAVKFVTEILVTSRALS